MTELQHLAGTPELYERLINRMELALEAANTAVRLRNELLVELEIDGLSDAEMELIEAYLEKAEREARGTVASLPHDNLAVVCEQSGTPASPEPARVIWLKDRRGANSASRKRRYSATPFKF